MSTIGQATSDISVSDQFKIIIPVPTARPDKLMHEQMWS